MSGTHPSEERLQQYVVDRTVCPQEEIDHIGDCPHCQALITVYGFVVTELDRQPAPGFDFDLAAAVMERVKATGAQERPGAPPAQERKRSVAVMWTVILLVIGVPAWLFRKSAYFVFTDMSPDFYWVLLATAGIVVGLFILRLQRKYQDFTNLINK
jgi:hypothetical protein